MLQRFLQSLLFILGLSLFNCNTNCEEICLEQEDSLIPFTWTDANNNIQILWLPMKKCTRFEIKCRK